MNHLLEIMRQLRATNGCPWDQVQTHQSLRSHMLDEAAEVVETIDSGRLEELPGELGDVLLQVAYHTVIAEEAGTFDYDDIEKTVCDKLIRRHPHVFGDAVARTPDEVVVIWEQVKQLERAGREKHPLERIPLALGALERERQAQKILERPVLNKTELQARLAQASDDAEGLAEFLSSVVAWGRGLGLEAEGVLRQHTTLAARAVIQNDVQ
jgi:XTP/dITP diphosphohydrolase